MGSRTRTRTSLIKLNALDEFIQTNKRRPSQQAKEEMEKRLGHWLSWQIQNRKNVCSNMVDQNIITAWDSFIKNHIEYFKTNEEIWYKKLEKVTLFIDENKKRPSTISKDLNERECGIWISKQMQNRDKCINIMKNENIITAWDSFIKNHIEYLKTPEEIWYKKLEKVKLFIHENKKRPSAISKDLNEKECGQWISHQITNRDKCINIMRNEKISNAWNDFIKNHIGYFKQRIIIE